MIQKKWLGNILLILSIVIFSNCKKEKIVKEIPGIQNFRFTRDTVLQSNINDEEVYIEFTLINIEGERGFLNQTDIISVNAVDKRDGFKLAPIMITANNAPTTIINEGHIVQYFFTSCCIYTDGTFPCTEKPNIYQTVEYEFTFETNFEQTFPKQSISYVLNCK